MAFIDEHRSRFGGEPICRVLSANGVKIAPSGHYAFKKRPDSVRARRDGDLIVDIERIYWARERGRGLSGARKVWRLMHREGISVARCTVERLMRQTGLRGVRRGKQFITTRPDDAATRPPDHVQRRFRAERPNQLWVADFTYVPTWSGMAFTAFVTDLSRWSAEELAAVAHALNTRPRKSLGWKTPAEAFQEHLDSLTQASVASTS